MFFSGPWHLAGVKEAGGAGFEGNWAIAPMPKKASATSFLGGANLVVFKNSARTRTGLGVRQVPDRPEDPGDLVHDLE